MTTSVLRPSLMSTFLIFSSFFNAAPWPAMLTKISPCDATSDIASPLRADDHVVDPRHLMQREVGMVGQPDVVAPQRHRVMFDPDSRDVALHEVWIEDRRRRARLGSHDRSGEILD